MEREYIYIFKGDDTNWNNERFVTVNVNAQTGVDLSDMTAKFMLGSYTKEYPLTTGSFTIDLSAAITGQYAFGPICGTIQILDSEGRIKTACNTIPFYITGKVIAEQHQTLDIDLPQGSPVSINLSVGGTVSYNDLTNKPSLNGVTIEGAKTSADYGLQPSGDYATQTQLEDGLSTKQDVISDLGQIRSNANLGATAVQPGTLDTALATKQDKLNSSQLAAVNSGIDGAKVAQISTNKTDISTINSKIPSQASSSNQLADKGFVNSTVQTSTAHFRGNWETYAAIPTDASLYPADEFGVHEPGPNDYLVVRVDETQDGGTWRYKYTGNWATNGKNGWQVEYEVNETPLTAAQLAALNSGITSSLVTQIGTNRTDIANLENSKQDVIADLADIRDGAAAGATALQPDTAASTYLSKADAANTYATQSSVASDLALKQPKILDTSITVDDVSQTTVEAALGAINTFVETKKSGVVFRTWED